jgi:hypothetical protein
MLGRDKHRQIRDAFTVRLPEFGGLTQHEMEQLATYNTERDRGLMHTPEWQEKMRSLQVMFDRAVRDQEYEPPTAIIHTDIPIHRNDPKYSVHDKRCDRDVCHPDCIKYREKRENQ